MVILYHSFEILFSVFVRDLTAGELVCGIWPKIVGKTQQASRLAAHLAVWRGSEKIHTHLLYNNVKTAIGNHVIDYDKMPLPNK